MCKLLGENEGGKEERKKQSGKRVKCVCFIMCLFSGTWSK